tara:strand:- start:1155 stop:1739 length:585 start_codon:yes stop_codon:yes gene_type:complete
MIDIESICVFCGSKKGVDPTHAQAARDFGQAIAARGVKLIYGGGRIGLMGIIANEVARNNGAVTGVIPDFLMHLEVGNPDAGELIITESMHTRKAQMFQLSDAIVIFPGGLGTLDEAFEVITWKQLCQHKKPIVLVDINGYWKAFNDLIHSIVDGGYAHKKVLDLFSVVQRVEDIFSAITNAPYPNQVVLTSHL